ncbi:MAG: ring-cleaving dioxygenase [Akkermansiaceae bacterium]|nr:ring-cleaving dioxygenase [Armatimonadota bacterium]
MTIPAAAETTNEAVLGLHHVTAISGDMVANLAFYTGTLGLRLVKKSINQDDVQAYHLFYADAVGSPGTDLTFFDWPQAGPTTPGPGTITRTTLRVSGVDAVDWWEHRLRDAGIGTQRDATSGNILFADPEGQPLALADDSGLPGASVAWDATVPANYALRGMLGVDIESARPDATGLVLERVLGFERTDTPSGYYEVRSEDGIAQIRVSAPSSGRLGRAGIGGVHHVAFRVRDDAHLLAFKERIEAAGLQTSGYVDRYYFHSLYFREPGGVLFELATDGPGMAIDEDGAALGNRVSIPPFLEARRAEIEADLRPLPAPAYGDGAR